MTLAAATPPKISNIGKILARPRIKLKVLLNNEFSIEHIIPNSSDWEGEIDKDRTGNMIPIIASLNCGRGNKHINYYNNTEKLSKKRMSIIIDC